MANNGRFQPGQSGNPATQFKPGNRYRWQPGQSGNPAGVPRNRFHFKESSNEALVRHRTADELVNLLCERKPCAIHDLQRLAGQDTNAKKVRRGRTAVKLANAPFVAAAETPDTWRRLATHGRAGGDEIGDEIG